VTEPARRCWERTPIAVQIPLELLTSETITVLTDSFQTLFTTCYGEEKKRRTLAAIRLGEALSAVDILPLVAENHEDYQPE
jgi:hypothetical protein